MLDKKLYFNCVKFIFLLSVGVAVFSCSNKNLESQSRYIEQKQYIPTRTYYPKSSNPYPKPYSGNYRNPYALPPRNYYPYYDYDQYYVAPRFYQGNEQQDNPDGNKPSYYENTKRTYNNGRSVGDSGKY